MAITERKVWVTTKGTKCDSFEAAENVEVSEQLHIIDSLCLDWHDESFHIGPLVNFLLEDQEAKPFVEAINHLYNQNPVSKTDAT